MENKDYVKYERLSSSPTCSGEKVSRYNQSYGFDTGHASGEDSYDRKGKGLEQRYDTGHASGEASYDRKGKGLEQRYDTGRESEETSHDQNKEKIYNIITGKGYPSEKIRQRVKDALEQSAILALWQGKDKKAEVVQAIKDQCDYLINTLSKSPPDCIKRLEIKPESLELLLDHHQKKLQAFQQKPTSESNFFKMLMTMDMLYKYQLDLSSDKKGELGHTEVITLLVDNCQTLAKTKANARDELWGRTYRAFMIANDQVWRSNEAVKLILSESTLKVGMHLKIGEKELTPSTANKACEDMMSKNYQSFTKVANGLYNAIGQYEVGQVPSAKKVEEILKSYKQWYENFCNNKKVLENSFEKPIFPHETLKNTFN